jgi:hypothetical protein
VARSDEGVRLVRGVREAEVRILHRVDQVLAMEDHNPHIPLEL